MKIASTNRASGRQTIVSKVGIRCFLATAMMLVSTTQGNPSYLYMGAPGETQPPGYTNWWTSEFSGTDNTYYNASNASAFEVGGGNATGRVFTDLSTATTGWKAKTTKTGSDDNGAWGYVLSVGSATTTATGYIRVRSRQNDFYIDEIQIMGVGGSAAPSSRVQSTEAPTPSTPSVRLF